MTDGVEIEVQGAAAETEIAEQVAQLETQLAAGPDAVIIAPLDGDAVIGVLESSGYEGVVVFCDTDCAYEKKVSFVGTSNEEAAYQGGVYGVSLKEDTKAVIIYGQEGDNTSNLRKAGYERALAEAGLEPRWPCCRATTPPIRRHQGDGGPAQRYPDGINLVLCHNDDTAIGALNAIQAAGVTGIDIIGFDGNASAVELIASGDLTATVAQQPVLMGQLAVETAVKALNGEAVDLNVVVDTVIIDSANCQDYLK